MLEAVGNAPGEAYVGSTPRGRRPHHRGRVTPTSDGFHTYGVLWTPRPDLLRGRQRVFDTATPSDMNKPMWMIANLAVGGGWGGIAGRHDRLPGKFNIDYIHAYALGDGSQPRAGRSPPPLSPRSRPLFRAASAAAASTTRGL